MVALSRSGFGAGTSGSAASESCRSSTAPGTTVSSGALGNKLFRLLRPVLAVRAPNHDLHSTATGG